jgi:tagaturonate reductase
MGTLPLLNRKSFPGPQPHPARILQFGEGNFLRAFVDWMVDIMNESCDFRSSVTVVQPIRKGKVEILNRQDGLYTVVLNGRRGGEAVRETRLIRCIGRGIDPYEDFEGFLEPAGSSHLRFVVSNTTEAGIVFEQSGGLEEGAENTFPGKLTLFLHRRFERFRGDRDRGLIILPCELIESNGRALKQAVLRYAELWKLGQPFCRWVDQANCFCNTLVDRIVPGFPAGRIESIQNELGYRDELLVEAELFHLWLIEGPPLVEAEFPAGRAGMNVNFVKGLRQYRDRKVRIMNGAHTCLVPVGLLSGLDTVREAVEDPLVGAYLRRLVFQEILPTLSLPLRNTRPFAEQVLERFANPYIDHRLATIALNSIPKWNARVLPTLHEYLRLKGRLPQAVVFSLAAMIALYRGQANGRPLPLSDAPEILELFRGWWSEVEPGRSRAYTLVAGILAERRLWGERLSGIPGLTAAVEAFLADILDRGMRKALSLALRKNSR